MSDDDVQLGDDDLRAMAVLQAALGAGPVFFWVTIGVLSQLPATQGRTPEPQEVQLLTLLSAVHAFLCLSGWTMGWLLFERTLASPSRGGPVTRVRAATILRLALFEGPALFGGVICLLAVQFGALKELPLVWLNAVSTFVLLLLVVVTFPTRDRVEQTLRGLGRPDE